MTDFVVSALYKFADLPDYKELQGPLQQLCDAHEIKGTLLLAHEGVNGTVCGTREGMDALKAWFESDARFHGWEYKESFSPRQAFYRMKVRLKKEIVTLRQGDINPNKLVGKYVEPEDWNALLDDPEAIILDTRNDYEVKIGTFQNALNPNTKTFVEFPKYVESELDPKKHKKIVMFCTGGIRCEKASSYMLSKGFEEVYHLKGGILKYLETVPKEESKWDGDCFVFDLRVSVGHGLEVGDYDLCYGCRNPVSEEDKISDKYEEGVTCPACYDEMNDTKRKRAISRHKQVQLAKLRNQDHIGSKQAKINQ